MSGDQLAVLHLPDEAAAPNVRNALETMMAFRVDDFGNRVCGVAPREGAGATQAYLRAHRLADADSDFSDRSLLSVMREFPPAVEGDDPNLGPRRILEWAARTKERVGGETFGDVAALQMASYAYGRLGQYAGFWIENGEGLLANCPGGSLWYVTADPLFLARGAFARSQTALQMTPDLPLNREEFERFSAFTGLAVSEGIDISVLLMPGLLPFSPGASGFVLMAIPHAFIYMPGALSRLSEQWPSRMPDLFEPSRVLSDGIPSTYDDFHSDITPADLEALLCWWIDCLNVVFSHGLDPTRHTDTAGNHDAAAQMAWLITVERMLADGVLILGQPQLTNLARVSAAFDLLDKAEALLGWHRSRSGNGFRTLLRRTKTLPRLKQAFQHLPGTLGSRFADHTEKLYEGLYEGVLGNAMAHRRTRGGVRVALRDPDVLKNMSADEYVSSFCRGVRNSAHGLLDTLNDHRDRFVLATNSGAIPWELPTLATMIMFALMADARALCNGSFGNDLRS